MLIRLRRWAGRSASLLFTCGINRFSHDAAHISSAPMIHSQRFSFVEKETFGLKWLSSQIRKLHKGHLAIEKSDDIIEPPQDKTNKLACAPSEDSDQPGHLPSLISLHCPHEKNLGP